jgi:hypothetical protein
LPIVQLVQGLSDLGGVVLDGSPPRVDDAAGEDADALRLVLPQRLDGLG